MVCRMEFFNEAHVEAVGMPMVTVFSGEAGLTV
jgi:hypothetical protein